MTVHSAPRAAAEERVCTCPVTQEAVEGIKLKDVKEQRQFCGPESVHVRRMT